MRALLLLPFLSLLACSSGGGGGFTAADAATSDSPGGSSNAETYCERKVRCAASSAVTMSSCLAERGTTCVGPLMATDAVTKYSTCSCDKSLEVCGQELGSATYQSFRTACLSKLSGCKIDTDLCTELIWLTDDAFLTELNNCLSGTCDSIGTCTNNAARSRNPRCM